MWKLLKIELFKIFRRPRTFIAFAAIAAMILVIQLGLKFDGKAYLQLMMASLSDSFYIPYGMIMNGYLVAFVILNLLLIQIPLLVALVAGDIVSGEADMGTLRLLMTKPVSRTRLMLVKFTASVVYTIALLIWMALLALFLSMLVFGTNDMLIARNNGMEQIGQADVFWQTGTRQRTGTTTSGSGVPGRRSAVSAGVYNAPIGGPEPGTSWSAWEC